MLVAVLAIISFGFGTFAIYAYLRASQGRVGAASIICLAYAALALTVAMIEGMRRRNHRLRRALAPASTSVENVDSLLQSMAALGAPQDQQALLAAMQHAARTRAFADAAFSAGAYRRFHHRKKAG